MREDQRWGRRSAAVVAVLAVALGACRTDRELTEPEPVPVTEENLEATLLTADDLPEGFTVVPGPGTPINADLITEHECDDALKDLEPELVVSTDFTRGDLVLTDTAAWFPGQGGAAELVYRNIAASCGSVATADRSVAVRAGGLNFGVLSDDTLALGFEIEPRNGPILERDLVIMRQGDLVHVVRLTGPRPSDKALLDTAVRATIGRLGLLHQDTT